MGVFVSSTYEDLVEHRRAVVDALERLDLLAGRMEVFGSRPGSARVESLKQVATSDLFVGVYAHRYGSVPQPGENSITQLEYEEAVRLSKPVFAFIVDDEFQWNPKLVEGEPGRGRLERLKQTIRSRSTTTTFTSPEDLGYKVATSVARYLLAEAAERIPVPQDEDPVGLEHIALLHTSFRSPKADRLFGDGRQYYQFEVIVIAPDRVMRRISSVTYHLEDAWPADNRRHVIHDRGSRFKMKELANGTSVVTADISIDGQSKLLRLNRFIDLRADGPRL